eukprot:gene4135-20319_t
MANSAEQIGLLTKIVDFKVHQDKDGSIWKMLNGSKDDFYVYDFCGKLSEYISKERSYLGEEDVKNAIVKTYNQEHQCGPCSDRPKEKKKVLMEDTDDKEPCHNLPIYQHYCSSWAKNGFCEKGNVHYGFMKVYCQRSCKLCKVTLLRKIYGICQNEARNVTRKSPVVDWRERRDRKAILERMSEGCGSRRLEESEGIDFKWIGKHYDIDDNGCKYYKSCSIDGQVYDINDDVLVQGDKDKSYACSVKCFYVDESREEVNRAEVCWLFAFKELPRKCRIALKNYSVHKKEVFQPLAESDGSLFENAIEDIDAETIGSLCFVKELGVKENIPTTLIRMNMSCDMGSIRTESWRP